MDTIKFPIQFDSSGLAKLREKSSDYYKQLLTLAILTEPGRLPLTPDFGINDPTYTSLDKGRFVIQASRFVPEVVITGIDAEVSAEEEIAVVFGFKVRD
jgi:hypothetical protein|tara:strand:- start:157 stop:453 length:297 start_codon:yes stop_codon:yes gene_type:complete